MHMVRYVSRKGSHFGTKLRTSFVADFTTPPDAARVRRRVNFDPVIRISASPTSTRCASALDVMPAIAALIGSHLASRLGCKFPDDIGSDLNGMRPAFAIHPQHIGTGGV